MKGYHYSPSTEFKPGQHWRPEKPYWNKDWLYRRYHILKKSAAMIASEFGIGETAIQYWLKKHKIPCRTRSEARKLNPVSMPGTANGMYGCTGSKNPNWKGGCTPERQSFYSSAEWKKTKNAVNRRDNSVCQRCGKRNLRGRGKHLHHIISFSNKTLRADPNNITTLCVECHHDAHRRCK